MSQISSQLATKSQQANNSNGANGAMDATLDALMRASLQDRPSLAQNGAPALSTPGLGAGGGRVPMAARRAKPGLKLSEMSGFGGAAQTFGLRVRPSSPGPPPARRAPPQGELGTPFASFSKIVYVFIPSFTFLSPKPLPPTDSISQRSFRSAKFQWKGRFTCRWRKLFKWCIIQSQHGPV